MHGNFPANGTAIQLLALEAIISVALPLCRETQTQPRAVGHASVSCKLRDGCTVLDRLHLQGSMKILFPRATDAALCGVILNTAGGITGGDHFDLSASVAHGCRMSLTTQAAERAYRSQPGEAAQINNRISVGRQARMDWLPQEMLIYDRSALCRSLSVEMSADARLLIVEPVIFGRAEMGEVLNHIAFHDRLDVWRDGQLVFADRIRLTGDASAQLRQTAIGAGCGAMAGILLASPDAEQYLDPVRELMPPTGGVSLIRDGLLFTRLLAGDGYALRQTLVPLIELLSAAPPPKTWMT